MGRKCPAQVQLKTWGLPPRSEAHHTPPFPEMPLNQQRRLENNNFFLSSLLFFFFFFLFIFKAEIYFFFSC